MVSARNHDQRKMPGSAASWLVQITARVLYLTYLGLGISLVGAGRWVLCRLTCGPVALALVLLSTQAALAAKRSPLEQLGDEIAAHLFDAITPDSNTTPPVDKYPAYQNNGGTHGIYAVVVTAGYDSRFDPAVSCLVQAIDKDLDRAFKIQQASREPLHKIVPKEGPPSAGEAAPEALPIDVLLTHHKITGDLVRAVMEGGQISMQEPFPHDWNANVVIVVGRQSAGKPSEKDKALLSMHYVPVNYVIGKASTRGESEPSATGSLTPKFRSNQPHSRVAAFTTQFSFAELDCDIPADPDETRERLARDLVDKGFREYAGASDIPTFTVRARDLTGNVIGLRVTPNELEPETYEQRCAALKLKGTLTARLTETTAGKDWRYVEGPEDAEYIVEVERAVSEPEFSLKLYDSDGRTKYSISKTTSYLDISCACDQQQNAKPICGSSAEVKPRTLFGLTELDEFFPFDGVSVPGWVAGAKEAIRTISVHERAGKQDTKRLTQLYELARKQRPLTLAEKSELEKLLIELDPQVAPGLEPTPPPKPRDLNEPEVIIVEVPRPVTDDEPAAPLPAPDEALAICSTLSTISLATPTAAKPPGPEKTLYAWAPLFSALNADQPVAKVTVNGALNRLVSDLSAVREYKRWVNTWCSPAERDPADPSSAHPDPGQRGPSMGRLCYNSEAVSEYLNQLIYLKALLEPRLGAAADRPVEKLGNTELTYRNSDSAKLRFSDAEAHFFAWYLEGALPAPTIETAPVAAQSVWHRTLSAVSLINCSERSVVLPILDIPTFTHLPDGTLVRSKTLHKGVGLEPRSARVVQVTGLIDYERWTNLTTGRAGPDAYLLLPGGQVGSGVQSYITVVVPAGNPEERGKRR
jgi:hypothetical protein